MKTSSFNYNLPENLIAQEPHVPRDECRMLVLDKNNGDVQDKHFYDIGDYLNPGDLLIANETRVMPARLIGTKRDSGTQSEILLLDKVGEDTWNALVKPGRRLKPGAIVDFNDNFYCEIVDWTDNGRVVKLYGDDLMHKVGKTPLPPYIHGYTGDMELYQTVYSKVEHSAAAPTAGLHFTDNLIDKLKKIGIEFEKLELEVGIDTFKPVTCENAEDHVIHTEKFSISNGLIDKILKTKKNGNKIVAIGTTSVRALESTFSQDLKAHDRSSTSLFILPGYEFKIVDAMITNFHVPKSSLMMLVSAFAGRDNIMNAYKHAIDQEYRFLSFGDAMFII